ncbi:hypothetical protein DASC09_024400 [Saccharomycopsis crataegensis]|uniref:L domain-like protein n=1 Tax=Saccharomycopsis crataegensis TaxID=43959 RepID=A0AAV5QKS2_9ASCO|nr:hypothetical protein DASC09_024400 [Saccharomycopsis crataegensis]
MLGLDSLPPELLIVIFRLVKDRSKLIHLRQLLYRNEFIIRCIDVNLFESVEFVSFHNIDPVDIIECRIGNGHNPQIQIRISQNDSTREIIQLNFREVKKLLSIRACIRGLWLTSNHLFHDNHVNFAFLDMEYHQLMTFVNSIPSLNSINTDFGYPIFLPVKKLTLYDCVTRFLFNVERIENLQIAYSILSSPPFRLENIHFPRLKTLITENIISIFDGLHWQGSPELSMVCINNFDDVVLKNLTEEFLPTLVKLTVKHVDIIEGPINIPKVQELRLWNVKYHEIYGLHRCFELKILKLEEVGLLEIPDLEVFVNLEKLLLPKNHIIEMKNLGSAEKLKVLNLSGNNIIIIQNVENLPNLSKLDLSVNVIRKIESLDKLSGLKTLYLGCNEIKKIEGLESLKQLEALDLNTNCVEILENLDELSNIQELNLYGNRLYRIQNISKLTNLRKLDLSDNRIKKIENLDFLTGMVDLYLMKNKLTILENVNNLRNLNRILLSNNNITKIENLDNCTKLTTLGLNGNFISKIENLDKLNDLIYLDLSKNQITIMENLSHLKCLKYLFLNHNKLGKIEGINSLASLEILNLSCNNIKLIENIFGLMNLREISLQNNQLQLGYEIP